VTPAEAATVEATAACEAGNHHRCRGAILSLTAAHGTPWGCACHAAADDQ
jgi:hypothetical protein